MQKIHLLEVIKTISPETFYNLLSDAYTLLIPSEPPNCINIKEISNISSIDKNIISYNLLNNILKNYDRARWQNERVWIQSTKTAIMIGIAKVDKKCSEL